MNTLKAFAYTFAFLCFTVSLALIVAAYLLGQFTPVLIKLLAAIR